MLMGKGPGRPSGRIRTKRAAGPCRELVVGCYIAGSTPLLMKNQKLDLSKTIKDTLKAKGFSGPIAAVMAGKLAETVAGKVESFVAAALTEPVILKVWREAQEAQAAAPQGRPAVAGRPGVPARV
jgi:hypothetical protein